MSASARSVVLLLAYAGVVALWTWMSSSQGPGNQVLTETLVGQGILTVLFLVGWVRESVDANVAVKIIGSSLWLVVLLVALLLAAGASIDLRLTQ